MSSLSLRPILQSYMQEEIHKFAQKLNFYKIFILSGPLQKTHTKTTKDIIKSLCVNFLHIERKLFLQYFFQDISVV